MQYYFTRLILDLMTVLLDTCTSAPLHLPVVMSIFEFKFIEENEFFLNLISKFPIIDSKNSSYGLSKYDIFLYSVQFLYFCTSSDKSSVSSWQNWWTSIYLLNCHTLFNLCFKHSISFFNLNVWWTQNVREHICPHAAKLKH